MPILFGIQPEQIEYIESELKRWNEPFEFCGKLVSNKMQYSIAVWEIIAKKIGWHPFSLALAYFEYVEGKREYEEVEPKEMEKLFDKPTT